MSVSLKNYEVSLRPVHTAKAMETQIFFHQEWATLDLMEVFAQSPAAKSTATHRVQFNPFFPLPLWQSV